MQQRGFTGKKFKRNYFPVTGSITLGRGSQSAWQLPTCFSGKRSKVRWESWRSGGGGGGGRAGRNTLSFPRLWLLTPSLEVTVARVPKRHHDDTHHRHCHHTTHDLRHLVNIRHDHARHRATKAPQDLQSASGHIFLEKHHFLLTSIHTTPDHPMLVNTP